MYYALNMWNHSDADPERYRDYLRVAEPCLKDVGGKLLCLGRIVSPIPHQFEGATIGGGQRWMNITTYEDYDGPKRLAEHPVYKTVANLRGEGTENYIWAYYEDANIMTEL
ncbi:MAG: hypothetical protein QOE54_4695 [Streptosporangiaceae bacterium]|nr:hypothetical protein [Streptosporangiaceae bacterium]